MYIVYIIYIHVGRDFAKVVEMDGRFRQLQSIPKEYCHEWYKVVRGKFLDNNENCRPL